MQALLAEDDCAQGALAALVEAISGGDVVAVTRLAAEHAELLKAGRLQTETGDTPLHLAAASRNVDIASAIVNMGAPLEHENKQGQTALLVRTRRAWLA